MRAKLTKEKLEEIQKYIATKDEESLSKFKSELLFGDWELEEVKTKPEYAECEPHPTITEGATPSATDTHTRTIKAFPTYATISTTERVLTEFQNIYKSWGLPSTETKPFLTTSLFEQIPSLIIKDTLETLIATDIKDKIKYYVNETPVLDITSIYPYHHFFKVAIEGYREKVKRFHLSVDRIQSLYLHTVHVFKGEAELMFDYIFKDSSDYKFQSDQFFFAICNQIPYFVSEYKKPRVSKHEAWEGIREDMERAFKGEDKDIEKADYRALDEYGESDWVSVRDSEW